MVDTAHAACRVGAALLWGNVAASCAAAFGAFAGAPSLVARRGEIADRAASFFAAARPEVRDAGRPGARRRPLRVGAPQLLPVVPHRQRRSCARTARCAQPSEHQARYAAMAEVSRRDPVPLQRRHRAAGDALGGRGPPGGLPGRALAAAPSASPPRRRSTASTSSSCGCSAASARGSRGSPTCAPRAVRPACRSSPPAVSSSPTPSCWPARPCRPASPARPTATSPPEARRTSPSWCGSSPTRVLLTGFGFEPPTTIPAVTVWDARRPRRARRAASAGATAGGDRLLPRPPRGREHGVAPRPGGGARGRRRRRAGHRHVLAARRCGRAGRALELCREHGVDVIITSTLAAGTHERRRRRLVGARPRRARHPGDPVAVDAGRPGRRGSTTTPGSARSRSHPAWPSPSSTAASSGRRSPSRRSSTTTPGAGGELIAARADPERTARLAAPRRAHGPPAPPRQRRQARRHRAVGVPDEAGPARQRRRPRHAGVGDRAAAHDARRRLPRRPHPGRRRRADGRAGRSASPTTSRR